jgi:hypothetical protein
MIIVLGHEQSFALHTTESYNGVSSPPPVTTPSCLPYDVITLSAIAYMTTNVRAIPTNPCQGHINTDDDVVVVSAVRPPSVEEENETYRSLEKTKRTKLGSKGTYDRVW